MLRERVLTAIVFVGVALVTVFLLPTWAMGSILGLVLVVGAWEWAGFGRWSPPLRWSYAAAIAVTMLIAAPISQEPRAVTWVLSAALAWWLVALIWITRFPTPMPSGVILCGGLLVLLPAWVALTFLHGREPLGRSLVFVILVVVWAADVGAYFVGGRLGRVKLAPRVSPGKTWEGVAGGVVAAGAAALLLSLALGLSWQTLVPLALVVAALSVVGDLTVSMFKRHAGLKDSGRLFPGHGGVLDRLDSLAAAAPVFVLGLAVANLRF